MKTIQFDVWENISPEITGNEVPMNLTTFDLIKQVAKSNQEGFTIEQMRNRIKILDKMEYYEGLPDPINIIELEDEQYKELVDALNKMKWAFAHKAFVEFADQVKNAK